MRAEHGSQCRRPAVYADGCVSSAAPEPLDQVVVPWHRRIRKIAIWLVGLALFWFVLQELGVNVRDWLSTFWDQLKSIWEHNPGYIIGALVFQSGQTLFAGLSYYGILKAAYKEQVRLWPVIAAYSVGVAMNGFLPANIGTFVTLVMFVAIIPSCTIAGAIAAYLVQKIFYTLAGTFVYVYMFLSVPGAFDISFGREHRHPVLTVAIVAGVIVGLVMLARIFWRQVKKLWVQAREGGVILSTPRRYLSRVFLPSFLGWLCKIAVTAIFLAAFAIPVTFESVMWVFGSGSLANVASFTPGSIGVTQATNALALKTCCNVPNDVAINYSTAQQLITTAWNQALAILLVCWVFGWTGGKQLVGASYADAKVRAAEMKAERQRNKAAKKEARQAGG
jgi:uncharacterized membrane protein YbhN (UPF0104 family)